jgi:hypothetical protein
MSDCFPLVTVLVPCKDVKASFFRQALSSVFSQSDSLWNLIVVYDLSDNIETMDIVIELKNSEDSRISVLKKQILDKKRNHENHPS